MVSCPYFDLWRMMMACKVNEWGTHSMTEEQAKKFLEFICGDDLDFYEEYLIDLTEEEQGRFFDDNPEFMSEYPIGREEISLLKDKVFRGVLRKIKRYKEEKRNGINQMS